jgi:hypothetical protein
VQFAFRILGIAARLLLVLGAACLLLGGYLAWRTLSFTADALRATGTVVSYHETRDQDATRYRPRVRFKTVTGEIVTIEGQLSTTTPRFAIGASVPVVYRRAAPTEGRIGLFTDNWLGATVAGVVAVVAFIAGWLIRRAAHREAAS